MKANPMAALVAVGLAAGCALAQPANDQKQATAVSPHALALVKIVDGYQLAPNSLGAPNGWDDLLSRLFQFDGMQTLYEVEHADSFAGKDADSHDDLRDAYAVIRNGAADEHERRLEAAGIDFIHKLEQMHYFNLLDSLSAVQRFVAPPLLRGGGFALSPQLGPSRALASCCAARMHMLAGAADWTAFERTFENALTIGRGLNGRCDLIAQLVSEMDQSMAFAEAKSNLLAGMVSAETARDLLAAVDRQPLPKFAFALEGERARGLEIIDEYYDLVETKATRNVAGDLAPIIGSRNGDARLWNDYFDAWAKVCGDNEVARSDGRRTIDKIRSKLDSPEGKTNYAVVDKMVPAVDLTKPRRFEADRDGLRIMLALEIWRSQHAGYPDTLDALSPAILPTIPKDPFNEAGTLHYRKDGDAKYLLYSVGSDGTDNGGAQCPAGNSEAAGRGVNGKGFDYILNTTAP